MKRIRNIKISYRRENNKSATHIVVKCNRKLCS